jgi:nitric oxide reductase activation protein
MGAAMRQARDLLEFRRERRSLLPVFSDGEPADVDEQDAGHRKWDAHAARAKGIASTSFPSLMQATFSAPMAITW